MHQPFDEQPKTDANDPTFSHSDPVRGSEPTDASDPASPPSPSPSPSLTSDSGWPWEPAPRPVAPVPTPNTLVDESIDEPDHPAMPDPPHATGQGTLNLIEDLESRLAHLREAASGATDDLEHERHELECRKREIEAKSENLREWENHLASREASVEADATRLFDEHEKVASQHQAIEDAQRELDARREELRVQIQDLQRAKEELDRRETDANHHHVDNQQHESHDHDNEMQSLKSRLTQVEGERDWANSAMEDLRQQRISLQAELEEVQSKLEEQGATSTNDLTPERAAELDRLRLVNEGLEGRVAELEIALSESRKGPSPNDSLAREIEAKQDELESCLQQIRDLEGRETERANVAQQLREQEEALAARDARITELESEIREVKMAREAAVAQLRAELATAQNEIPGSVKEELEIARHDVAEREEAITRLSNHIRTLQSAASETRAAAQQADESYRTQIQSLREETERRVEEARREGEEAGRASVPPVPIGPTEEQILRRQRLQNYRQALSRRRNKLQMQRAKVKDAATKVRNLDGTRQTLVDFHQTLEKMERRMVRRWARPKATTHAFMLLLMVMLVAGTSYFGVMEFWPVPYVVNATVDAKGDPGVPLNQDQRDAWQSVHEQMIMSEQILDATSERLRQRGLIEMANREVLDEHLAERLSHNSTEPGKITFHLTGSNSGETTRLLETYLLAFMSESNAGRSLRTDRAKTRILTPATLDPVPIEDPRLIYAGYTFGGSLAAVCLLMMVFYMRLTNVKKVLDIDDDLFTPMLDDGEWERISQGKSDADGLVLD